MRDETRREILIEMREENEVEKIKNALISSRFMNDLKNWSHPARRDLVLMSIKEFILFEYISMITIYVRK